MSPRVAALDATIASTDAPTAWGFPIAQSSFERSATSNVTVIPRGWAGGITPQPGPFALFLNQKSWSSPEPPLFAALPIAACAATGIIVGFVLAISYVVALLFARTRPRLAPPSCAGCGSTARGVESTLPQRCSECGRSLDQRDAVHWTPRLVRRGVAMSTIPLAVFGVAALSWWLVPAVSLQLNAWLNRQVATPERFGEWYGAMCLGKTLLWRADSARMQLGWGTIQVPMQFDAEFRETAETVAARRIASDWRESPELAPSIPRFMTIRVRQELARCVKGPREAGLLTEAETNAAIDAMILEAGIPSIVFPRCVRVGQPIRVVADDLESGMSAFFRPKVSANEAQSEWTLANSFTYATPQELGDVECAIDWALIFPLMGEQLKPIPSDVIDRRLQALPLRGHASQRVRVLPASDNEIVIDAPEMSPLQRPVYLTINELGERDEIELNAWTYGSGVTLRGEWVLELPRGVVTLVHQPGSSLWVALAPMPAPLPDELIVRFVPRDSDPAYAARPPKTPPIVWSGQTEVHVHRVPWDPPRESPGRSARYASTP